MERLINLITSLIDLVNLSANRLRYQYDPLNGFLQNRYYSVIVLGLTVICFQVYNVMVHDKMLFNPLDTGYFFSSRQLWPEYFHEKRHFLGPHFQMVISQ